MASSKKELAEKLFAAINAGSWEEVIDSFDDEGALIFPGSSPLSGNHQGRERIKKYFRRMNIAVPDLHFQILEFAESEKLIVLEWKNGGKTRNGLPYENKGVTILEFKGDKVLQLRDYLDTEKLKPAKGQ